MFKCFLSLYVSQTMLAKWCIKWVIELCAAFLFTHCFYSGTDLQWNIVKSNTWCSQESQFGIPQFSKFQIHLVQKITLKALCESILTSSCCTVIYLDSTGRYIVGTGRWTAKRKMARGDESKNLRKRTDKQENG